MKKLFISIVLTSVIVFTSYGIDTDLPADVQKQYNNLVVLIQNGDADAFKSAFDAIRLPVESIASLQNIVVETQAVIAKELKAMGNKTKNWSQIIKGMLAVFGGSWAGLAPFANASLIGKILFYGPDIIEDMTLPNEFLLIAGLPACWSSSPFVFNGIEKIFDREFGLILDRSLLVINTFICFGIAYKGIPYGIKTFKNGLDYKEYLQTMLVSLDAIDKYMQER